jgi:hypothetical protein
MKEFELIRISNAKSADGKTISVEIENNLISKMNY